ncbi:MAG: dihydrofolate reductase family protein [Bacteroidales bacterium]|nr:dihydrofolate reductase family protein [Bacteroidales bacterium]
MKPKIICHMISSVDGRLIADRWSKPFDGTEQDKIIESYYHIEKELDISGWIVGRNTIQEDFEDGIFDYEKYQPAAEFKTYIGNRDSRQTGIVFDAKGKTLYQSGKLGDSNIIAVLGEGVSEEYLSLLREKGISYLFAGKNGYDLDKAVETLHSEFGFNHLLLEGGGVINGMFLKAGLIDELSLLIYPGIDGLSGVSSIIEYKGEPGELPAQNQALELLSVKELSDGVVWLLYKFHTLK